MRAGSDHEGDGGWPGPDYATYKFNTELRAGRHFRIIPSEGQQVIESQSAGTGTK